MALSAKDLIAKVKRATLDKTDLDERIINKYNQVNNSYQKVNNPNVRQMYNQLPQRLEPMRRTYNTVNRVTPQQVYKAVQTPFRMNPMFATPMAVANKYQKPILDYARLIPRGVAEAGLTVNEVVGGKRVSVTPQSLGGSNPYARTALRSVLGTNPLKSHLQQAETGGVDTLSSLGVNNPQKFVPAMAFAGFALDATPPGFDDALKSGGKRLIPKVAKVAGKTNDFSDITRIKNGTAELRDGKFYKIKSKPKPPTDPLEALKVEANTSYRGAHQILGNTKPASELNIDEVVKKAREYNGYLTKYDLTDLNKLKKMQGNPDAKIKIFRASPVNELNNGDWITTSKTYAQDIKRQNGGKVYEYIVKVSDLKYPNDITELPSLARFSAFKYEPTQSQLPKSKVKVEATLSDKSGVVNRLDNQALQAGNEASNLPLGKLSPEQPLPPKPVLSSPDDLANTSAKANQLPQTQSQLTKANQSSGKLTKSHEVLIKRKVQPELPAGKTLEGAELLDYERGLTSSLVEPRLAQQGVKVKLMSQTPKRAMLTPNPKQYPIQELEAVRQAKAKLTKATQNDFPSVENIVRSSNLDVKNKVNILDYWLRTPDRVLRKIGMSTQADVLKTSYNNYLDELPKEMNKVTDWYKRAGSNKDASQRIFKYLDGQKQELSGEELRVANEMRSYLSGWADRLGLPKDGRIAHYITHIFEKDFIQKEFDPELAKLIQDKVPGSVYDPFLQQRLGKLGYVEDAFRAMDAYVKRATRKANMDPALEQLQEASKTIDLDSWNYVKKYADRINLRPTDTDNLFDNLIKSSPVGYKLGQRPVARVSRNLRQMVYRGTLGLNIGSAIRNLTQGVNTYAQLGEKYTAQGYLKAIQSIATKSDELERVGVLRNSFIEDRSISATKKFWEKLDKGLFYFFEMAEKINRGAAYYGAKSKALASGASEADAIKAGVDLARKTQFTFGSVDTPVSMQSDIVKLVTQFQSFNIKQTEFLAEMVKNKEFGGMMRWLGANAVILFTVGQAMGWDWKDMIPFGSVADGQSPIGSSPAITLVKDIGKLAMGGNDKYGQPLKPDQILKDLIPLVPGGVQLNKTIGGLKDVNRGYDESASGRVKFPIAQTPRNYIQGGVLGSYNLPEAKEYRKNEGSVMGENQSAIFKSLSPQDRLNFFNSRQERLGKTDTVGTPTPVSIPTDQATFNELYKKALSNGTDFPTNKALIEADPTLDEAKKTEKIEKLRTETAQWAETLITMQDKYPKQVFTAELKTYGGNTFKVPERADWIEKQLNKATTDTEIRDMLDQMWEAGVLTTGKTGTAQALIDRGINVYALGNMVGTKSSNSKSGGKSKKVTLGKAPSIKKVSLTPTRSRTAKIDFKTNFKRLNLPKTAKTSRPKVNLMAMSDKLTKRQSKSII